MIVERKPPGMELIDILDRILDKGAVIDASARLHLPLENLRKMHTRIVVDSIETFTAASKDSTAKLAGPNLRNVVELARRPSAAPKLVRRSKIRRPRGNSA